MGRIPNNIMQKKDAKIWKFVNKKVRGAFGDTDYNKKLVRIDKAKHKKKTKYNIPEKDNTLLNSIVHEDMHTKKPKMTEVQVRKQTRIVWRTEYHHHDYHFCFHCCSGVGVWKF